MKNYGLVKSLKQIANLKNLQFFLNIVYIHNHWFIFKKFIKIHIFHDLTEDKHFCIHTK